MDFFFKRKKPSQADETKETTAPPRKPLSASAASQDDDLFGDMDLDFSSPPPPPSHQNQHVETTQQEYPDSNVKELQDLVLTDTSTAALTNENTDTEVKSSVFGFINQGGVPEECTNEQRKTVQDETDNQTIADNDGTVSQTIADNDETDNQMTDDKDVTEMKGVDNDVTSPPSLLVATPSKQQAKGKKKRKARLPGNANKQTQESRTSSQTKDQDPKGGNEAASLDVSGDAPVNDESKEDTISDSTQEQEESRVDESPLNSEVKGVELTNVKQEEEGMLVTTEDGEISTKETVPLGSEPIMQEKAASLNSENDTLEDGVDTVSEELFSSDMNTEFDNKNQDIEEQTSSASKFLTFEDCEVVGDDQPTAPDVEGSLKESQGGAGEIRNKDSAQQEEEKGDAKFCLELTENEKLLLAMETLNMRQHNLRNEIEALTAKRDQVIIDWKLTRVNVDTLPAKIGELQEKQQVYAEQEDYDQAAEMQQQIYDLNLQGERFKFEHPAFDEKISNLIVEFKETSPDNLKEKEDLLQGYQEMLAEQETKMKSDIQTSDRHHEEVNLQLKEEKLTLDRKISHLSLDQEHLKKNQEILDGEVEKKTTVLAQEKQVLVEKRAEVQTEMKELEETLKKLRIEESNYTDQIDGIDHDVDLIKMEFQPRLQKIEKERLHNVTEKIESLEKMAHLEERMMETTEAKQKVLEEQKRNETILKDLGAHIDDLHKCCVSPRSTADDTFQFDGVFDLQAIIKQDDVHIESMKEQLRELETKLQTTSQDVLSEKSRLATMQRSLNDLETRLAEMQKVKQAAVKERNYKDAKRVSEEIKLLTEEGETKQNKTLDIEQSLKLSKENVENLQKSLVEHKKIYSVKLKEFDCRIIDSLLLTNKSIRKFLESNSDTWFKDILDLQFSANEDIVKRLQEKHTLSFIETSNEDEERVLKKITDLELQLQHAEETEDWDLAEKLNEEIELTKDASAT